METIKNIVEEATVAYSASEEMSLIETSRRGIPKKLLQKIADISGISIKEFSALLPVSLRTIQRYNDSDLLDPAVSERVLQIAEVLSLGFNVFQSEEKLSHWLHTPSVALGHQSPFSLLDTGFGIRMVTNELGRIEHGVFS